MPKQNLSPVEYPLSLPTPSALSVLPDPTIALPNHTQQTCLSYFADTVARKPQKCAVVDNYSAWTYQQLDQASSRLAAQLHQHGVGPNHRVAIYAQRSATLPLALLGILKAGAAFLILDLAYPPEMLCRRAQIAQPDAWIILETAGQTADQLPDALKTGMRANPTKCCVTLPPDRDAVEQTLLPRQNPISPECHPKPETIAYLAFTSGSTSASRALSATHAPLAHFLDWHIQTFALQDTDQFALLAGLSHDPLLRDIFTPLCLGATLHVPDPDQVGFSARLLPWLAERQVSVLHLTPALGDLLANAFDGGQTPPLPALRYAFFGGDRLRGQTVQHMLRLAPQVTCVNFYGATETPQAMAYCRVDPSASLPDCIPLGAGIEGVQLLVVNQQGELAGIGEAGEIYVRTPFLSKGYLGDPQSTAQVFLPDRFGGDAGVGLYRTGDWGCYLGDGSVAFAGRRDDQVKLRGYRIDLGVIEQTLLGHGQVEGAVVLLRGESSQQQQLVAYVVSQAPPQGLRAELLSLLQTHLPAYMLPSAFVVVDSFPLTPNGKIDRQALPEPEAGGTAAAAARTTAPPPDDPMELQLLRLWEQALGKHGLGVTDDFFALGGNSLIGVSLLARIEREWGLALSLRALVEAPTIGALAALLHTQLHDRRQLSGPIPLQPQGTRPPLFCAPAASGGSPLQYRALAAHIGHDQPVYALEPRGLDGTEQPHEHIEEMAAYHIRQIRAFQPEGPYYLCGLSLGGNIAYEMAQQLQAMGQEIGLLILFDTLAYPFPEPPLTALVRYLFRNVQHLENLRAYETPSQRFRYFCRQHLNISSKKSKRASDPVASLPHGLEAARQRVIQAQQIAGARYHPAPYAGDMVLLRARVQRPWVPSDPALGWRPFIQGSLTVIETPGTHFSILDEPCIQSTVVHLRRCLEERRMIHTE